MKNRFFTSFRMTLLILLITIIIKSSLFVSTSWEACRTFVVRASLFAPYLQARKLVELLLCEHPCLHATSKGTCRTNNPLYLYILYLYQCYKSNFTFLLKTVKKFILFFYLLSSSPFLFCN